MLRKACLETIEVVDPLLPTSPSHWKSVCRGTLSTGIDFQLGTNGDNPNANFRKWEEAGVNIFSAGQCCAGRQNSLVHISGTSCHITVTYGPKSLIYCGELLSQ
ncbi:hypothetical protein [Pseudomonas cichorii]|uniref:hypothetical protein n=1 Tax=Pseudomonas cichorii TaxID=36746 RepID=UPI0011C377E3|nr:hypothetical protein [Pseudomonas cichorii]